MIELSLAVFTKSEVARGAADRLYKVSIFQLNYLLKLISIIKLLHRLISVETHWYGTLVELHYS